MDAIKLKSILTGRRADLSGANLRGAELHGACLPRFIIIPEQGSFIAWKKGDNSHLIKIRIPAKAKRTSSLVGRKCRAEFVKVLEIWDSEGEKVNSCGGWHQSSFLYTVGETVYPDSYDPDIRVECSHGIHFFVTKEEALNF